MNKKGLLIQSIKISGAALLAILVAGEMGLEYSATAGIITILGIRGTKTDTLKSVRDRGLAYLAALGISWIVFFLCGFTLWAFGLYLLLFTMLCLMLGWREAITADSVLVSHFLTAQTMSFSMIMNETGLFLTGAVISILVNLHLHRKEEEFRKLSDEVDVQIKGILSRMADWLLREDKSGYGSDCFVRLEEALENAQRCAADNYQNRFFSKDTGELDYIRMRSRQSMVLRGIYENIRRIEFLPSQAVRVSELLREIEQGYHKNNTVEGLLLKLNEFTVSMQQERLPVSREEFEARAILYHILLELGKLLRLKREYILSADSFRQLKL